MFKNKLLLSLCTMDPSHTVVQAIPGAGRSIAGGHVTLYTANLLEPNTWEV